MKRLVVCCDGTWNRPDQVNRGVAAPTNVAKFALALADRDADGQAQCLHYEAGVGTRRRERLLGGAFGVGLSRNVRDGYRFLVDNYEPGDDLYFLGFSRGAFTARSVAGLIRNCRHPAARGRRPIDEAYALYRARDATPSPSGLGADAVPPHVLASRRRRRSTSSASGTPSARSGIPVDASPPLLTRMRTFHDTRLSRVVRHAYHALRSTSGARRSARRCGSRRDAAEGARAGLVRRRALRRRRRLPRSVAVGDPLLWMVEKARGWGSCSSPTTWRPARSAPRRGARSTPRRPAPTAIARLLPPHRAGGQGPDEAGAACDGERPVAVGARERPRALGRRPLLPAAAAAGVAGG